MTGRSQGSVHGVWHAPRGSDPTSCDAWREVLDASGTAWSAATDYVAGDHVVSGNLRWEAIQASGPTATPRPPGTGFVGAIEPGVDNNWPAYWWCQASYYINGATASPSTDIPNPVPMRYRLSIGAPNVIDTDTGDISVYTEHQIDIQGDLDTGILIPGDVIFVIPPEYRHDHDVPYPAHDQAGFYIPCRLLSISGEFVWGKP